MQALCCKPVRLQQQEQGFHRHADRADLIRERREAQGDALGLEPVTLAVPLRGIGEAEFDGQSGADHCRLVAELVQRAGGAAELQRQAILRPVAQAFQIALGRPPPGIEAITHIYGDRRLHTGPRD